MIYLFIVFLLFSSFFLSWIYSSSFFLSFISLPSLTLSFFFSNYFHLENADLIPEDNSEGIITTIIDDQEWELIKYTVDGEIANINRGDSSKICAFLAIQRRSASKRIDHITDVNLLFFSH